MPALLVAAIVLTASGADAPAEPVHTELGLVPIVGGDSDVGLTLGAAGSVVRFAPGADPYDWRLEFAVVTSLQPGSSTVTHQDYHVGLVVPELFGSRVRTEGRIGFSRFGNGEYHGLGVTADAPSSRRDFGLIYPEAMAATRVRVWRELRVGGELLVRYVWPSVSDGGTLAARLASPSPLNFGKVKLFGNAEVRWRTVRFTVLSQRMQLGVVAFVDGGRLFADWKVDRAYDGGGFGFVFGTGGGLRIYWGQTFVLRADVAWSPDARPVAFYFNVDQAF